MSTKRVRAILEGRLSSWAAAQSPAIKVAWENAAFIPATGEKYLRATLLPAETRSQDLKGDHRAYTGVFQISIVLPKDGGSGPAMDIANSLDTHFPVNGRYTSSGFTVQIVKPASVGPAVADEAWYIVPVSIWYRADTI